MEELFAIKLRLEEYVHHKTLPELTELRKLLHDTLKQVDHSIEQQDPKTRDPRPRCPRCHSGRVRKHGTTPSARFYCLHCDSAYPANRQPLFYRRRHHDTILDLIVEIHTTSKSSTEIIQHLGISTKTYYEWRKVLISVFPQLEAKFKNRRKK